LGDRCMKFPRCLTRIGGKDMRCTNASLKMHLVSRA